MTNIIKAIGGILSIIIVMPIWYYLLYKILISVQATELMMFLFWVYIPLGLLLRIMTEVAGNEK